MLHYAASTVSDEPAMAAARQAFIRDRQRTAVPVSRRRTAALRSDCSPCHRANGRLCESNPTGRW